MQRFRETNDTVRYLKIFGIIFNEMPMGPRAKGMTGMSRGIEYHILYEILHTVCETW